MSPSSIFTQVSQISQDLHTSVYVVGGFVRDEILKRENKKDIDFVVLGDGIVFAQAFAKLIPEEQGTLVEFPDFGTARFVFTETLEDGGKRVLFEIEFASARKESYRDNSRKPSVEPATLEEDLSRRDFTVNALAREVLDKGKLGDVVDHFSGQKDIVEKILRTPLDPDTTFSDDPLRMLRAARFAAQLEFAIDLPALEAMMRNAERLKIISAERIQEELMKLLATRVPSIGLKILYHTHLLDQFLPEVNNLAGVEEVFGYSHKDNLSHTFAVVDNVAEQSNKPLLRFAALMHDIAKPDTKKFVPGRGWTFDMHEHLGKKMTRDIMRRLRFSVPDSRYVQKLVRWHLQPIALMDEGVTDTPVRRLIVNLQDDLQDLLYLCRADITTGNQKKKVHRLKNYDYLDERIKEVIETDKLRAFQSPLRGDEIMTLCNLKPGPTVGKIKTALEEAILEGIVPNDYEAVKAYFATIKDQYLAEAEVWEKLS